MTTEEKSSDTLNRPKYNDKSSLIKNSTCSQQNHRVLKERPPSERHQRHSSEPNKSYTRGGNPRNNNKLRPYSALTTDILEPKQTRRQLSADAIRRGGSGRMSPSFRRLDQMSTAICAYTGSSDLLKYHKQQQIHVPGTGRYHDESSAPTFFLLHSRSIFNCPHSLFAAMIYMVKEVSCCLLMQGLNVFFLLGSKLKQSSRPASYIATPHVYGKVIVTISLLPPSFGLFLQ